MLELAGISVDAISVGGLETCIQLPDYDLAFDVGRCPYKAVWRKRIFLTHAHMDHAGGLAWHAATRDLYGLAMPTYYVPKENYQDFLDLFAVWRRLDRSEVPARIVPVSPDDRIDIGQGCFVTPFRSPHRVYCQGYTLWRRRRKLKDGFVGLPGPDIEALRRNGVEVSHTVETPEVCFPGDAISDVVDREETVRTARLLILEATFLDDTVDVAKTRTKGHIHLDEIIARAEQFHNAAILLTHFSRRYSAAQIQAILDEKLPPTLRERVTPLLPPDDVGR